MTNEISQARPDDAGAAQRNVSSTDGRNVATSISRSIDPREGLVAGLLVAAVVHFLISTTYPIFHVPEEFHIGMNAPTEAILANRRATDQVLRYHAMLYAGSLGLLLGLLLGGQEGVYRRVWITPVVAALLGGAGGALGGFLGCLVYEYVRTNVGQASLMHTILAQWLMGAPLGLGIGIGFGWATKTVSSTLKAALGGVAAATLAAVLYPVLVSIVLPDASTDALVPEENLSRALWLVMLAGLIGLLIPIAIRQRKLPTHPAQAAL